MSLDLNLHICTNKEIEEIQNLVISTKKLQNQNGMLIGDKMLLKITSVHDIGKELINDIYNFKPTLNFNIRLISTDFLIDNVYNIVSFFFYFLNNFEGDYILDSNGNIVLLIRKNNQIILNKEYKLWDKILKSKNIEFTYKFDKLECY